MSKNANLPSPWRVTMATPREASESASHCLRIASPRICDALADALRSLVYETDHIEHIRPQLNKAAAALSAYDTSKGGAQ